MVLTNNLYLEADFLLQIKTIREKRTLLSLFLCNHKESTFFRQNKQNYKISFVCKTSSSDSKTFKHSTQSIRFFSGLSNVFTLLLYFVAYPLPFCRSDLPIMALNICDTRSGEFVRDDFYNIIEAHFKHNQQDLRRINFLFQIKPQITQCLINNMIIASIFLIIIILIPHQLHRLYPCYNLYKVTLHFAKILFSFFVNII